MQLELPLFGYETRPDVRDFLRAGGDGERQVRRRQALGVYPVLRGGICRFADTIDAGAPLAAAIARVHGTRPATVRALRRSDLARAQARWGLRLPKLLEFIDATPPNWLPRDFDGWTAFLEVQTVVHRLGNEFGLSRTDLLKGFRGRWQDQCDAADGLASEVEDFVNELYCDVVGPEIFRVLRRHGVVLPKDQIGDRLTPSDAVRRMLGRLLFAGKGLRAVAETVWSRSKYTDNPLAHPKAQSRDLDGLLRRLPRWKPLSGGVEAPNGLCIVPLAGAQALAEESRAMEHCIIRFAVRLGYRAMHAVSVRAPAGFPLVTAMLVPDDDGALTLCECRGAGNITPDPRARRALSWYIAGVNDGRIAADVAGVEADRRARARLVGEEDAATDEVGYNFHDADAREWVFQAYYAPFLPAPAADSDRAEWLRRTGLADLARDIAGRIVAARPTAA